MWNRVKVVTRPVLDPITVADIKARLRIDGSDEDALLGAFLSGAIASIDGPDGIGYALMEQTWRLTLDGFPCTINLPGAPVKSVASITYIDTDGTEQTLDAADYRVDVDGDPARIAPAYGKSWPTTRDVIGAVKVDYVLGEADSADVAPDLIDALCLLVAHRHAHRQAVAEGQMNEIPLGVESILSRYRRGAVA